MHRAVPAVSLTLAGVLLSGCGSDRAAGPDATAASSLSTPAVPTTSPTPAATPTATESSPVGTVIEVSFTGGKVSGDTGRVKVKLGEGITIKVTSDVAEEVHLHGYDLSQQVAAGGTATLDFDATIPGVFEVELERQHKQLLSLQVQ